jgi:hypothetical protein
MNTAQIKALQDDLVKHGYMTQEQVNTGYGIYGPKTTAAFAKYQADANNAITKHPAITAAKPADMSTADHVAGIMANPTGIPYNAAQEAADYAAADKALAMGYEQDQAKGTADTAAELAYRQATYANDESKAGAAFQSDKTKLDQAAADNGVLFSGGRAQKLQALQSGYSADAAQRRAALEYNTGNTMRDYQYKYGNDAAQAPGLSQYYQSASNTYNPNVASGGVGKSGLSSIYSPTANNYYGTNRTKRASEASADAALMLKNRSNKLFPNTGYKTQL